LILQGGWSILTDGTNADFFAPPIEDEANLATSTICFYEVFKRVLLEFGDERTLDAAGIMSRVRLENSALPKYF